MTLMEKAAIEAHLKLQDEDELSYFNLFKAGAEWQRKQLIDKACEWLKANFNMPDDFELHFRKAMEE